MKEKAISAGTYLYDNREAIANKAKETGHAIVEGSKKVIDTVSETAIAIKVYY